MSWYKNLKVQARLLFFFTLLTCAGALSTGWNILALLRIQDDIQQMQQRALQLSAAAETEIAFLERWLAGKNYLLSGGDMYFSGQYERYDAHIEQYTRDQLIAARTVNETEDVHALRANKALFDSTIADIEQAFDAAQQAAAETVGPGFIAYTDIQQVDVQAQLVQNQLDTIRYKRQLEISVLAEAAQQRIYTAVALGVFSLIALLALVIMAALVTGQVTEPLLHLNNAVVAFEFDTFEPEMLQRYSRRRDEMGQLSQAFTTMAQSITESVRTKDQFLNAAARFVPEQYLDFLSKPSLVEVNLGDHVSREMSVMFSDIRSFTTMSEQMTPQENFNFVNDYLKRVSPVIQQHDGFIVKFLGDGMMAVFPYSVDDAVRAGIAKQRAVHAFNAHNAESGQPPIHVGIGIHTGHMMVGMIGEERRMQGDAFSDNVNLTARIEGLTKFYGVSLIISEETRMRLEQPEQYLMRFLGKVQVKGRETPISLYDVYEGDPPAIQRLKQATQEAYTIGLRAYISGNFAKAQEAFSAVLQRFPEDAVSRLYLERTRALLEQPTPKQWDGVEVMTQK